MLGISEVPVIFDKENKIKELTEKITEAIRHATEACERIETTRDLKSIEREMGKLKQKVREKGPGWASFGRDKG